MLEGGGLGRSTNCGGMGVRLCVEGRGMVSLLKSCPLFRDPRECEKSVSIERCGESCVRAGDLSCSFGRLLPSGFGFLRRERDSFCGSGNAIFPLGFFGRNSFTILTRVCVFSLSFDIVMLSHDE